MGSSARWLPAGALGVVWFPNPVTVVVVAATGVERGWTFLSNHGHVLVALGLDPDARMRDIAVRVGVTERAVQTIVHDLEEAGYVHRRRVGRRNTYTVSTRMRLRHPLEAQVRVGDLIGLVTETAR